MNIKKDVIFNTIESTLFAKVSIYFSNSAGYLHLFNKIKKTESTINIF